MVVRVVLFACWALLGGAGVLGLLYVFTPLGPALLLPVLAVAWLLKRHGWGRSPELWGLLAGPGLFCLLVASSSDEPSGWFVAAAGFGCASIAAFVLAGRLRCRSLSTG